MGAMGSSSSKAVAAAGGASRKFPSRAPGSAIPSRNTQHSGSSVPPSNEARDRALDADAADPDSVSVSGAFSQRLHSMGIAEPSPAFSPSSRVTPLPPQDATTMTTAAFPPARSNATLSVLEARRLLELRAAEDLERLGRQNFLGRRFLDMRTVIDVVEMRDRGTPSSVIERKLGLERGLMDRLGPHRILSHLAAGQRRD